MGPGQTSGTLTLQFYCTSFIVTYIHTYYPPHKLTLLKKYLLLLKCTDVVQFCTPNYLPTMHQMFTYSDPTYIVSAISGSGWSMMTSLHRGQQRPFFKFTYSVSIKICYASIHWILLTFIIVFKIKMCCRIIVQYTSKMFL